MRLASKKFTFLLFLQIRSGTAVTVFRRSTLPLVSVFAGLVPGHRSSDEIKHDDTKYTRNGDADIVQRGGIHGCLINHIAEAVVVEDDLAGNSLGHVRGQIGGQASVIGRVTPDFSGRVVLNTEIGTKTLLPEPSGELLPRIC